MASLSSIVADASRGKIYVEIDEPTRARIGEWTEHVLRGGLDVSAGQSP